MRKYRKGPVVVEAVQYLPTDDDSLPGIRRWLDPILVGHTDMPMQCLKFDNGVGGMYRVYAEDWIIKTPGGFFVGCNSDTFSETYEPVDDDTPGPCDPPAYRFVDSARLLADVSGFQSAAEWCGGKVRLGPFCNEYVWVRDGVIADSHDVLFRDDTGVFHVLDNDEFYRQHDMWVNQAGLCAVPKKREPPGRRPSDPIAEGKKMASASAEDGKPTVHHDVERYYDAPDYTTGVVTAEGVFDG